MNAAVGLTAGLGLDGDRCIRVIPRHRCKDWSVIRGLYEAIIESVEMGEAQWTDCFDHYEMMVPSWRDESR